MEFWQIWLTVGILLLIFELFLPMLFFASISFGCFIAAILSFLKLSLWSQIAGFTLMSIVLIAVS